MTDVQTTPETELRAEEPGRTGTASTRRLVLLGAGAVGATAVLAACGTNTSSTNTTGSDYSDTPGPAGSAEAGAGDAGSTADAGGAAGAVALAKVADVPTGGGVIKGDWVITQPTAGTFKAFTKVCTHQGCDVSKVDDGVIVCPCHGSKFSIEDGSPKAGPATKALAEKKVKADGANIVAA
jgi:Rieske Fe-S protein